MKTARSSKARGRTTTTTAKEFAPRAILVPTDFSPLAEAAMERAKIMARQFGSKLVVLHAVEPVIHPVEYAIVPSEMEEINIQLVSERKIRLAAISHKLKQGGISCRAEVKLGKPWHVICDFAKSAKCDLIVIATHGHTGPKHLLVGSTTERVVQHAPCSVLVVR